MNRLQLLKIRIFKALSQNFNSFPFFLQGRMDIDAKSLWYDEAFNNTYGGYLPLQKSNVHKLGSLPNHDHVRQDMLLLLCKSIIDRNVSGAIAELGVYRGETARLFHHYMPDRKLYLLDTFEGFNEKDVSAELQATGSQTSVTHFSKTSTQVVLNLIKPLNQNVHLIKGYFPDSATEDLKNDFFAMVHLDADLYQPTIEGLQFFYPRLSTGGLLVVHDYNAWFGARKAVEEFTTEHNLIPIPMPDKSGSCVIMKLK